MDYHSQNRLLLSLAVCEIFPIYISYIFYFLFDKLSCPHLNVIEIHKLQMTKFSKFNIKQNEISKVIRILLLY